MGLLELPLELFCHISSCLKYDSDLSSLAITNKAFYKLLNDDLYRHTVSFFPGLALEWAARNGVESTARKLLEVGASPSLGVDEKYSPMGLAIIEGHDHLVKLLLKWALKQESSEKTNSDSYWLDFKEMGWAIESGRDNLIQLFIECGAIEHWTTRHACAAISKAIRCEKLSIVELLVDRFPETLKEDINWPGNGPLLHEAVYRSCLPIVRFLVRSGADVNFESAIQYTPLALAAEQARPLEFGNDVHEQVYGVIDFLLEEGASPAPDMPDRPVLWPLRWAAERNDSAAVEHHLSQIDVKSIIRTGGENWAILLLTAAACGLDDLARQVLENGGDADTLCDPRFNFWHTRTPLCWTAKRGHAGVATILLAHGACRERKKIPAIQDNNFNYQYIEFAPLSEACKNGHIEVVKLLLDHGADITARNDDDEDCPALYEALKYPQIVDFLLLRGADAVEFQRDYGSALEEAVSFGYTETVQVMINHDVPLDAAYPPDLTMIQRAKHGGAEMLTLLTQHGVKPPRNNGDDERSALRAIRGGDFEAVLAFLEASFTPHAEYIAMSCLEHAAHAGNEAIVDSLLRYGADIGKFAGCETGCLDCCLSEDVDLRTVQILLERGASPLPESSYAVSVLSRVVERNHNKVFRELLRYLEKRTGSGSELRRNIMMLRSFPLVQDDWHRTKMLDDYFYRSMYPVPS